jgi:hypothetical protein
MRRGLQLDLATASFVASSLCTSQSILNVYSLTVVSKKKKKKKNPFASAGDRTSIALLSSPWPDTTD